MAWNISSLVQARQRFVQTVLRNVDSVAQCCRGAGISRKTGFKWLARFRQDGQPGLHNRSRRPRSAPRRTPQRWLEALAQQRRKHPQWGAKKIHAHWRRQHPRARLPKVRTLTKWLRQLGLVPHRAARARRGPRLQHHGLTLPQGPNDVWTIDFKGWFRTGDGRRVDPLTVRDLFSRYVLGIRLLSYADGPVRAYSQRLFQRYGLPKVIRVDHGAPFAGDGALSLSRLSAWWWRLGIQVEFTRRGCPQDNGAHEQMHRIYKCDVANPPARTPTLQQSRTTRWVRYYNEQRPHEALGQKVPAQFYRPSRRRWRALPQLHYPRRWPTRRVTNRGWVSWHGRQRMIGRAFTGQPIGLHRQQPGHYAVYFGRQHIGQLVESDAGGMRPARWDKVPRSQSSP